MELVSFTVLLLLTAAFLYGTIKPWINWNAKKNAVGWTKFDVFKLVLMVLCTILVGTSFIQIL